MADGLELYRWMSLTRRLDDAVMALWKQGRGVGGVFSGRGHEAISVGTGMALGPDDVVAPMHRDLGTYLVRGMTIERIVGNLLGRATGVTRGRDANLHGMGDLSLGIIGFVSHLPQSMPTTLGVAMAFRHRAEARVALTFVGDGGTTAGAFHETLNMAALYRAPFVLVIENNQYAYSTPLHQQTAVMDFAAKARAHGVRALTVDGNDIEAVHAAVAEAIERARAGGGPSAIEAVTMRMRGHAIHDGAEYVPAELLAEWERRDPLLVFGRRLIERGDATPQTLDAIDAECGSQVGAAISHAEAAPMPDPAEVERGVYA